MDIDNGSLIFEFNRFFKSSDFDGSVFDDSDEVSVIGEYVEGTLGVG